MKPTCFSSFRAVSSTRVVLSPSGYLAMSGDTVGSPQPRHRWGEAVCASAQVLSPVRLCNLMDCSPPGSSICGIFPARILQWVASSNSRGSSPPRGRTSVCCISSIWRWTFFFFFKPLSNLGSSWGKARGATKYKYPTTYRVTPKTKNYPAPNVNSAHHWETFLKELLCMCVH